MKNVGQRVQRTVLGRWAIPGVAMAMLLTLALSGPVCAAERSLAGIRIFSSTKTILKKYGNPSQVIVGRPSLAATNTGAPGAGGFPGGPGGPGGGFPGGPGGPGGGGYPGGGGFPGGPGAPGGGYPGAPGGGFPGGPGGFGGNSPGSLPGFGGAPDAFGGGGFPGAPGGFPGAPGMGGPGAMNGINGTPGSGTDTVGSGEVTWIYNRPAGSTLEFTMSNDGRVIQIRATGYKNASVKTSRGITLGATYANVVAKYGYPESQEQLGIILVARYTNRAHAAFEFYNQRLVAIIVAAVE